MEEEKRRIRAELFRRALAGEFPTYGEIQRHLWPDLTGWRREWSDLFNQIAMEEISHGYPDITLIVHKTGEWRQYPSQIHFRQSDPPDEHQMQILLDGTDEIIRTYHPGAQNYYRANPLA